MSTPRKKRNDTVNKMFPGNQVPRQEEQPRSISYDAEISITGVDTAEPFGRFILPCPTNADNFAAVSSEDSQNFNQTTVFNGKTSGTSQPRNTGIQTSPSKPAPLGTTRVMQTSPKKVSQTEGTQTTPPSSPKRSTLTGGTQTTPPQDNIQDQGVQGQLDHNHIREDLPTHNTVSNTGKG